MLDTLEDSWRNTENNSLIDDLYRGTTQDYIKCGKCKTEKIRGASFLELSNYLFV